MEQTLEKRHGAKDVVASEVGVLSVVAMFYAICCAGAFGIEEMIPECEPEAYPINPKTHLGFGDVKKIGLLYAGIGVFAVFARFFIGWNEGSWGEEYYLEEYETGIFSDFGGMLTVILVTGIVCLIVGIIVWLIGRRVE